MSRRNILLLGPSTGWHAEQMQAATTARGVALRFGTYESLRGEVGAGPWQASCDDRVITASDLILTRTMPSGTLDQITLRLAILHALERQQISVFNSARTMEIAIDKFATLAMASSLGWNVPRTVACQHRSDALQAFDSLGQDVVVKPLLGSEGKGVMRVTDRQLAWTTFTTLERLGCVHYVQQFIPPGGRDLRLLVWGDELLAVRRHHPTDWRTNVAGGAACQRADVPAALETLTYQLAAALQLRYGAFDIAEDHEGTPFLLEVNAIPGWKGAEAALGINLAQRLVDNLLRDA